MTTLRLAGAGMEPMNRLLLGYQENLGDATPAFAAMAEYQVRVVNKRQFDEQGSSETGRWSPLSPPYGRWKARVRPGRPILVFDGDLRREMTVPGQGVYDVWRSGFRVGTDIPYAIHHQNGAISMPARPLIGSPREKDMVHMTKILQRWIVERKASA